VREPIWIGEHAALRHKPELEARHMIFECGNGYGLSVVTAKGDRWEHGLYCSGEVGSYEMFIICDVTREPGKRPDYGFIPLAEPIGWANIEMIGDMIEAIEQKGREAWTNWIEPWSYEEETPLLTE